MKQLIVYNKFFALFCIFAFYANLSFSSQFSEVLNCRLDPKDLFEPDGILKVGKNKGLCLDTEHDRNYQLLEKGDLEKIPSIQKYDPKTYYIISNFKHKNQYWVAIIPKDNPIKEILYQLNRVPPRWLAAHVEIRINFKKPNSILLYSQNKFNLTVEKINSFTISNSAIKLREGPPYDLYSATQDLFALSRSMISTEQILSDILAKGNDIDQYKLTFPNGKTLDKYLEFAIHFFHDPDYSFTYNTLTKNCSTTLFDSFDQFTNYEHSNIEKVETTIPILNIRALQRRGLTSDSNKVKSMREEFGFKPLF